jgi:acyl-ACP thioesterase
VDETTGRPRRVSQEFHDLYGEAAGGRTVKARPRHAGRPPEGAPVSPWPLRFSDFDLLRHVNNANYWIPVEEALSARRDLRAPLRAEVEHRGALEAGAEPVVAVDDRGGDGLALWVLDGDRVAATAVVRSA